MEIEDFAELVCDWVARDSQVIRTRQSGPDTIEATMQDGEVYQIHVELRRKESA